MHRMMVTKLTRQTHKIVIKLHLVAAVPFAVLTSGGQSRNFWIHPYTCLIDISYLLQTNIITPEITLNNYSYVQSL